MLTAEVRYDENIFLRYLSGLFLAICFSKIILSAILQNFDGKGIHYFRGYYRAGFLLILKQSYSQLNKAIFLMQYFCILEKRKYFCSPDYYPFLLKV